MRLPEGITTPALVVDLDVLESNLATTARLAADLGVALRPHVKTHKCLPIAARQLAAGARGLSVATTSEAEVFADGGADDLFIAYPVWADAARGRRLRALAERVRLRIGVDSIDGAAALARHGGTGLEVLVEIDSGHHRTGVAPAAAGDLALAAARAGLTVVGVFTFPGHAYAPGAGARAAGDEVAACARGALALQHAGLPCEVRSGGSTPSLPYADPVGGLTELRPGVYVFGDAQQLELGVAAEAAIALVAVATVISHRPGRIVLDAGSKVLGADRAAWASGYGRVYGAPDARIVALAEHHATVEWPAGCALPELGSTVAVIPNHVCNAVNLADRLIICRDGTPIEEWAVHARGANT